MFKWTCKIDDTPTGMLFWNFYTRGGLFETVAAPIRFAGQFAADRRTVAAELLPGVRFAAFLQGLATFPVGQVMIAFGPISVLDLSPSQI